MTADYDAIRAHEHAIAQVVPLLTAMQSVAEIAFRRAEERLPPLTRYAELLETQLSQFGGSTGASFFSDAACLKTLLLVITSERGLCGAFNQHLVSRITADSARAPRWRQKRSVGSRPGTAGKRLFEAAKEPLVYWSGVPSLALPSYADIEKAALDIFYLMDTRRCGRLIVTHNAPRRRFQYEVTSRQLFPLDTTQTPPARSATPPVKPPEDIERRLTYLVTVKRAPIDLYEAVIQSAISEELARVAAMKLATDNAQKLLEELTAEANHARQLSETSALLKIISGFEAASRHEGV